MERLVAKPLQRLIEQRPLAAFQSEEEQGHGRKKGVGQRGVETVEEEVVAAVGRICRGLGLIEVGLDGGGDPGIAAFAGSPVVETLSAKSAEVSPHQLGERPLDRREILVGFDDREQRVGAGGEMREMIARSRHDEVEVAIDLLAIALGDDRLERGGGLLEGDARLCGVAAEFAETKAEPEKRVTVGMQVVAELRRKGWRVRRQRRRRAR